MADGNRLHFQWQEGQDYGKGVFRADPSGNSFSGTWGYAKCNKNGGIWAEKKKLADRLRCPRLDWNREGIMYNTIGHDPRGRRHLTIIAVCFIVPVLYSCDICQDCEKKKYDVLYEPYLQALLYPEDFPEYLSENSDIFNKRFYKCADQIINRKMDAYDDARSRCDDIFLESSPEWNSCYDEAENEYLPSINLLLAIVSVSKGETSYEMSYIALLAQLKSLAPEQYAVIIAVAESEKGRAMLKQDLQCKEENCEDKCGIGCMISSIM